MIDNDPRELFDDLSRQSTPERTSAAAARMRAAQDREHRVAKALDVTRELHKRQQEQARRREERAFR